MAMTLTINGEQKSFDAPARKCHCSGCCATFFGMTGTKFGCGNRTVRRLHRAYRRQGRYAPVFLPVSAVRDRAVTTIEGVGASPGRPLKVQKAWLDPRSDPVRITASRAKSCRLRHCSAATPTPDDSDNIGRPRWLETSAVGGTYVRISRSHQAGRERSADIGGRAMTITIPHGVSPGVAPDRRRSRERFVVLAFHLPVRARQ